MNPTEPTQITVFKKPIAMPIAMGHLGCKDVLTWPVPTISPNTDTATPSAAGMKNISGESMMIPTDGLLITGKIHHMANGPNSIKPMMPAMNDVHGERTSCASSQPAHLQSKGCSPCAWGSPAVGGIPSESGRRRGQTKQDGISFSPISRYPRYPQYPWYPRSPHCRRRRFRLLLPRLAGRWRQKKPCRPQSG